MLSAVFYYNDHQNLIGNRPNYLTKYLKSTITKHIIYPLVYKHAHTSFKRISACCPRSLNIVTHKKTIQHKPYECKEALLDTVL